MSQRLSVIGLGRMGSALATILLEDHYKVTVWNRTAAKAEPLVEAGATLAASVNEAIDGSEIIIVCLGNYDATNQIFSGCADLTGKTLIQLTWGTAAEAEAMQPADRDQTVLCSSRTQSLAHHMVVSAGDRSCGRRAHVLAGTHLDANCCRRSSGRHATRQPAEVRSAGHRR